MSQIHFSFEPEVQKLIDEGVYRIAKKKTGEFIGTAIDSEGKYVAKAVAVFTEEKRVNPLSFSDNFNGMQKSLGLLQSSTAILGVGVAASVALSAASLWQILELRKDVARLEDSMNNGFADLKHYLKHLLVEQNRELSQHIDKVAEDIKFNQHRIELIKAYGKFVEASRLIKRSLLFTNISEKNLELANARQTLSEALSIYNSPDLLEETCAAGQLRRYECSWIIEQVILRTYQLQNQFLALKDGLLELDNRIKKDCLSVIEKCSDINELDFIYPEIHHILNNDLLMLDLWQKEIDWRMSLSSSEIQQLSHLDISTLSRENYSISENDLDGLSSSLSTYEKNKKQSHFTALSLQLEFALNPDLRENLEEYVCDQAIESKHRILTAANLKYASDLSIANLMCFFALEEK